MLEGDKNKRMDKICIVGLGRLGLPLALVFCKAGYQVEGVETSRERLFEITAQKTFVEPEVNRYFTEYGENLEYSTNYNILKDCSIVFVVVPTPSLPSGLFDLSYVKDAVTRIHEVNPTALIVIVSTINPGDCDNYLKPIHPRIIYNPSFIHQGSVIEDFEHPKFLLIGSYSGEGTMLLVETWSKVTAKTGCVFTPYFMTPLEAEIAKLSLNVSFTLGITFANAIGELCDSYGADSRRVLDAIYADRRNYMPGLGYSGTCFPRDVECFNSICSDGVPFTSISRPTIFDVTRSYLGCELSETIQTLNDYMSFKYRQQIWSHKPKTVAFLGVAYKDGVELIDESQPIKIIKNLLNEVEPPKIYVYDKYALKNTEKELGNKVEYCSSPEEAVEKADIIFIGTPKQKIPPIPPDKTIINPWKQTVRAGSLKGKQIEVSKDEIWKEFVEENGSERSEKL